MLSFANTSTIYFTGQFLVDAQKMLSQGLLCLVLLLRTPSKGSRWEDQGTKIVFFFSVCGGKKLEIKLTAGILGKNKTKYTKG